MLLYFIILSENFDHHAITLATALLIFAARPDCLPQIASLAVRSGNAVILKVVAVMLLLMLMLMMLIILVVDFGSSTLFWMTMRCPGRKRGRVHLQTAG
jgi:hypothetical protein